MAFNAVGCAGRGRRVVELVVADPECAGAFGAAGGAGGIAVHGEHLGLDGGNGLYMCVCDEDGFFGRGGVVRGK